jgi:hypothetical protein
MKEEHTIKLLKECDSGAKMGVDSFDLVLKYIKNEELRNIINETRLDHLDTLKKIKEQLNIYSSEGKDPNMIISEMSKIKMKVELSFNDSDSKIAKMMMDGCNMGIKALSEFKNKYNDADEKVLEICQRLISKEENLSKNLRRFL